MTLVRNYSRTIILCLLVAFVLSCLTISSPQAVFAATPQIDKYLTNVYSNPSGDGGYYVTYTVKQARSSSYEKITIGYTLPAQYRMSGVGREIDYIVGQHTVYLPPVAGGNVIAWNYLAIDYAAYSYTEKKGIKSYFRNPYGTWKEFHEVTYNEAVGTFIAATAPGIAIQFTPVSKVTKVAGGIYSGWQVWSGYQQTINTAFPAPQVGHYYEITKSYDNNGHFNIKYRIWSSKASYQRGEYPMWTGTTYSFTLPQ